CAGGGGRAVAPGRPTGSPPRNQVVVVQIRQPRLLGLPSAGASGARRRVSAGWRGGLPLAGRRQPHVPSGRGRTPDLERSPRSVDRSALRVHAAGATDSLLLAQRSARLRG